MVPSALANGEGAPAIVFLHGIGSEASIWRPQLAHFGQRRLALAWTMPGYDDGRLPSDWDDLADGLVRLLDARGLDRVHLVGHSIGGMIGQVFCARYPDRLASLVLSATSPSFGKPDGDWQKAFVEKRLAPIAAGQEIADFGPEVVRGLVGPNCDRAGLALAIAAIKRVPTQAFADAIRLIVTFDQREALAAIGVQTLVLAGGHDSNAPAAMMERMAGKIKGARYVCLESCGHLANVEDADAFNSAIDGSIDR
ncbi:MAG: alpha/beta fold hydrolase [Alphaproteobacteria bacterium]